MFSATARAALVALCFSAAAAAGPALSLKAASPAEARGVDALKVTTVLQNTGDVELKLLNDPRGVLSTAPTHAFTIATAEGKVPAFSGMKVKYVPEAVIAMGSAKSFTVLAPGQSVELTHDLSAAYNFTSSGEAAYEIEPSNLFFYVDPLTSAPVALRANAEVTTSRLTGKLSVPRRSNLEKRIGFTSCSASRQSLITTAANNAVSYASSSLSYLQSHTTTTTRYTTWFGTFTTARHNTVQSHYQNIVTNTVTTYTYDCTCTDDYYAYVYPDQFGYIYLCNVYWTAPATGTDSKAGTIIHESSHFTRNGGTDDYAYGQSAAKSLAIRSPAQAIMNADSHEYFAENTPVLS